MAREIKSDEQWKLDGDCQKCSRLKSKKAYELGKEEQLKQVPRWIPVSERLPEDTKPVNITWVNHKPEAYYADIKDRPFTDTGCYCDGKWYWYSVPCQDYLDECRYCDVDSMAKEIEVIAWMPLPEPYKAESEDKDDN